MSVSRIGRIGEVGRYPFIRYRTIPATAVERDKDEVDGIKIAATPDDHFSAGPYGGMGVSAIRYVRQTSGCPAIIAGIVSTAGAIVSSAPDDHLTTRPDCGMVCSAIWRVSSLGSRPIA